MIYAFTPEYAARAERTRPLPWAYRRIGCQYPSFFGDGGCGEPVAGTMRDNGPPLRACLIHLERLGTNHGLAMSWHCSVCLRPVDRGWRLDESGRCRRCAP